MFCRCFLISLLVLLIFASFSNAQYFTLGCWTPEIIKKLNEMSGGRACIPGIVTEQSISCKNGGCKCWTLQIEEVSCDYNPKLFALDCHDEKIKKAALKNKDKGYEKMCSSGNTNSNTSPNGNGNAKGEDKKGDNGFEGSSTLGCWDIPFNPETEKRLNKLSGGRACLPGNLFAAKQVIFCHNTGCKCWPVDGIEGEAVECDNNVKLLAGDCENVTEEKKREFNEVQKKWFDKLCSSGNANAIGYGFAFLMTSFLVSFFLL